MSQMFEVLIEPENYTEEIIVAITEIKFVMDYTLVQYTDDDIKVFQCDDAVYVLANPLLGEEPIFDEFGRIEKMVPLHNLTIEQDKITCKMPRVRIMRPELCKRIVLI